MLVTRSSEDRGYSDLGWLKSRHTFSFSGYNDPLHMGFESLRVINDDYVMAGAGFDTHSHKNMEIISYVLDGTLAHKDIMGNGSIIKPGDIQRMSAGIGITHSEYNHSKSDYVHFLQIWFLPKKMDITPSYEQKMFNRDEKVGKLKLVTSSTGRDGSVSINQEVDIYAGILEDSSQSFTHTLKGNRKAWIHIARGSVSINGQDVKSGDGISCKDKIDLEFTDGKGVEVILFDMAPLITSNT